MAFGFITGIQAQSVPASEAPSFEVASIRRSNIKENSSIKVLPDRFTARNQSLDYYIKLAYGHDLGDFGFWSLRDDQLTGGPSWVYGAIGRYEGYDVDAKVDDTLAEGFSKLGCGSFLRGRCAYRSQMLQMLQTLLADRFQLKVRQETRQVPVYALVVAKGGPKFLHAKFDTPDDPAHKQNPSLPRPLPPPCPEGMICWQNYASMALLADVLCYRYPIERPVFDRTGLEGGYYLKVQFAHEAPLSASAGTDGAPPPLAGPSIFTALEEQLGLKLVNTKGPVQVIVIEHIERPSEN